MSLNEAVGAQVRLYREQRAMSLTELARRADIGKGTLSNLEAGRANPTLETLEALARALALPLTDLLTAGSQPAVTVVRATEPPEGEFTRQFLSRLGGGHSLELWRLRMPAGHVFDGVAHAPGTVEHLLLIGGSLTAGPIDSPVKLAAGDLIAFGGETPHRYVAGPDGADIHLIFATPTTLRSAR